MSNQIKVDTTKVEEYISRLERVKNRANTLDSNLKWYARCNWYNNVVNTLDRDGSPSDFTWRIDRNISYLEEVVNRTNGVENFLNQLDPLNYAESLAQLEQQTFSFGEFGLGIISEFGILGPVINATKGACAFFQDSSLENAFKLIGNAIGISGTTASIFSAAFHGDKNFSLINTILGLTSKSSLGKAVKAGATWTSVLGAGISSIGDTIKNKVGSCFKVAKDNLGKFSFAAKWATKIINVGTTLYDNYKEYRS